MIAEFKAKNFFSLRDEVALNFYPTNDETSRDIYTVEVAEDVHLLKIGCIYGSNASGKTNILFALNFFTGMMIDAEQKRGEGTGVIPFLLDDVSYKEKTEFEMVFYLNGERYILSLVLDDKVIYKESLVVYTSVQPTLIYERTYNTEMDAAEIKFGAKSGLLKKSRETIAGNTIPNRTVIAAFGISNVEKTKLNLVYEMFSEHIAPAMLPTSSLMTFVKQNLKGCKSDKLKAFILHFLKASDFNISDFSLRKEEIRLTPEMESFIRNAPMLEKEKCDMLQRGTLSNEELYFTHHTSNGDKELDEQHESMGTKRYMGLATILYDLLSRSVLLPIDEVETSIHYELLSYFIKVFLVNSKRHSQLILTTHDINLLDEDYIRRDTIWFTDKDDQGATTLHRLSSLGLHKTMSVYNAYRQDKLINLPFLDSIYLDSALYEETEE